MKNECFTKYGLTEEEIAFIESMIRPMEIAPPQDSQGEQDINDKNE